MRHFNRQIVFLFYYSVAIHLSHLLYSDSRYLLSWETADFYIQARAFKYCVDIKPVQRSHSFHSHECLLVVCHVSPDRANEDKQQVYTS